MSPTNRPQCGTCGHADLAHFSAPRYRCFGYVATSQYGRERYDPCPCRRFKQSVGSRPRAAARGPARPPTRTLGYAGARPRRQIVGPA